MQGDVYHVGVDGLREGLQSAGLVEGPRLALIVRDAQGERSAVESEARALERDESLDVLVALATSVALAARRGTQKVPIVFVTGSDPVAVGLVESIARPGGRLTGIHSISTDLTSKRIEVLREIIPTVRRILTFYNPANPAALSALQLARPAAGGLGIELLEEAVQSTSELRARLDRLRAGEADAYFFGSDAMVNSQGRLILARANALNMPVVAFGLDLVREGALVGYGFSYRDLGRRAASYVARILGGASPRDLPVEAVDVPSLAVNLRSAKALGLAVPLSVLGRADEVIE
jgi:putative ABC transport system substrate-binding protein